MIVAQQKSALHRLLEIGAEVGAALVGGAASKEQKQCGGCPQEKAKIERSRQARRPAPRSGFRRMR